jgi:hypothetical protein
MGVLKPTRMRRARIRAIEKSISGHAILLGVYGTNSMRRLVVGGFEGKVRMTFGRDAVEHVLFMGKKLFLYRKAT